LLREETNKVIHKLWQKIANREKTISSCITCLKEFYNPFLLFALAALLLSHSHLRFICKIKKLKEHFPNVVTVLKALAA